MSDFTAKAEHKALTSFGMDLSTIRQGFLGGHFTADDTAAEFRAACIEVVRRLERLAVVA